MSYQIAEGDPIWTCASIQEEMERQVAAFGKAQSPAITTQAAWVTFVNALTAGQALAVTKGILRCLSCASPPAP